jgi:hypothetical protein
MNRILPKDFELVKYGLTVRLVEESDAEFIFNLRSDPELSAYLQKIPSELGLQVDWLREYKKRERQGKEYYFIYFAKSRPIGLYRMANVQEDSFMGASLVFKKDSPAGAPLLASLILFFIGFEILDKSVHFGDGLKENSRTIKLQQYLGFDFIHEDSTYFYTLLSKRGYYLVKQKLEKIFKISE